MNALSSSRRWLLAIGACLASVTPALLSGCDDGTSASDGGTDGSLHDAAVLPDASPADGATNDKPPSDGGEDVAELDGASSTDIGEAGVSTTAVMFLPDSLSNTIYRYAIAPGVVPVPLPSIALDKASAAAISPGGEMFVSAYDETGTITRYPTPLGAVPTASGSLTGFGVSYPEGFQFVDNELWVPNTAPHACTTEPQNLIRIAFDAQGMASVAGTVQMGLNGANRGALWVPATRDFYVSQCHPVDTILHFRVALDHSLTAMPAITGGLNDPHGMVMTSWGELLVLNAGDSKILRFTVDPQGAMTATGTITGAAGHELSLPVGMAFTPWDELVVVSQNNATLSRFTFDPTTHAATESGYFMTNVPSQGGQYGIGWLVIQGK